MKLKDMPILNTDQKNLLDKYLSKRRMLTHSLSACNTIHKFLKYLIIGFILPGIKSRIRQLESSIRTLDSDIKVKLPNLEPPDELYFEWLQLVYSLEQLNDITVFNNNIGSSNYQISQSTIKLKGLDIVKINEGLSHGDIAIYITPYSIHNSVITNLRVQIISVIRYSKSKPAYQAKYTYCSIRERYDIELYKLIVRTPCNTLSIQSHDLQRLQDLEDAFNIYSTTFLKIYPDILTEY